MNLNTASQVDLEVAALEDDNFIASVGGFDALSKMDVETLRKKLIEYVMNNNEAK